MNRLFVLFSILVVANGCATNYYERFYHDARNAYFDELKAVRTDRHVVIRTLPDSGTSPLDFLSSIIEEGYLPIGRSNFKAEYHGMKYAVDAAERHGAQLVALSITFKERQLRTDTVCVPSYSTSYTSGTAYGTVTYGWGQTASVNGTYSGTTSTTTLSTVPVQRLADIYVHDAIFFRKINPSSFYGAILNIPKRLPSETTTNAVAVTVAAVMRGSRAADDGLHRGQRVLAINGMSVTDYKSVAPFSASVTTVKSVEVQK